MITTLENSLHSFAWDTVLRDVPGVRTVVLGHMNHQTVVAKFFLHKLRSLSHQQTELMSHEELVRAGVLTPSIVYAGKDVEGHPVIIYEFIEQTADSRLIWNSSNAKERLSFLKKVASILAAQHIKGLCQHDLHPSNFIIVHEKCYTLDPVSIDVYQGGVAKMTCLENLGELCAQIAIPFYNDYQQAVSVYCEKRGWPCDASTLKTVEAWQIHYRQKREKKYVEKLFRECTRVTSIYSFYKNIFCWRERYTPSVQTMLFNVEKGMAQGSLIKAGNSHTVVKVTVDHYSVVVKRYNIKNIIQKFKRLVKNKARKSWINSGILFFHHVPTPMPIALVENKWGPFRGIAYFVSEYVEGQTLAAFLKKPDITHQEKEFIFREIKSLFKSLQRLQLSHGDMKATNFLVTKTAIMITDMDAMQKHTLAYTFKKAHLRDKKRFLKNFQDNPDYQQAFATLLQEF